ncbi:MAG: epimerase [Melioribacteraceae bacterium]|nr:MAG: epimerase [Melioribacteraceae bacterium]
MIKVGITGQPGFIGTHLYNYFGLQTEKFERIEFKDEFFEQPEQLREFVSKCDAIVHLAALNRHNDPDTIYKVNLELVNKLITATEETGNYPHIVFSSSTQEERDNIYGKSKREGRELLEKWANRNNAKFTGLVIPNVFGPFGRPFYNSVVSTFSHQIVKGETPEIQVDAELNLIDVGTLTEVIANTIENGNVKSPLFVDHIGTAKVSEILDKLISFRKLYQRENIIPALSSDLDVALFNTFRSYFDLKEHYPVKLIKRVDNRGFLVENIKEYSGGQNFYSVTKPGITRGNHFHRRKIERFCVLKGKAIIRMRKIGTSEVFEFEVDGENPTTIDMPIWYTHNITNIGDEEMITLFWSNEIFNPEDPDTYFVEV